MASKAPAITSPNIAPSAKRLVAQKFKRMIPELNGVDDGAVFQAIQEQFPADLKPDALAQAIDEQFQKVPAFGAATVLEPTVVHPKPPKENPSFLDKAFGIASAVGKGIGEQFQSITHELPQGLVRAGEGLSALDEAQASLPAFAGASDQISPAERALREEEAKAALGRGALEAGKGAAPIVGAMVGAEVAPFVGRLGAGKILTSALATGSDFGTYDFLTALGEGKNVGEAMKEAAGGFGTGFVAGGAGRFVAGRVGKLLERNRMAAAAKMAESIPGMGPTKSAGDVALDADVSKMAVDHADLFAGLARGQLTSTEVAQALVKRMGGTADPATMQALAAKLDSNLPAIITQLGKTTDAEAVQAAHGAVAIETLSPEEIQARNNQLAVPLGKQELLPAPGETSAPRPEPVYPAPEGTPMPGPAPEPPMLPEATPQTLDAARFAEATRGYQAEAAARAERAARDRALAVPLGEQKLLPPRPEGRVTGELKGTQQELGLPTGEITPAPAEATAETIAPKLKLTKTERQAWNDALLTTKNDFKYKGVRTDPLELIRKGHPELAAKIEAAQTGSQAAKSGFSDAIDQLEQSARARIEARKGRLGAGQDIFLDLGDHAILAATHIVREGASSKSVVALRRALVDEFGPGIKKHLPVIIEKAKKLASNIMKQFRQDAQFPSLERLLKLNTEGKFGGEWYGPTHEELTRIFGRDADMMERFIAATSANTGVDDNIHLALRSYQQWKMGEPFTDKFHLENLNRVARGEEPSGLKVNPFYHALTGDPNAIVADIWMLRLFGFKNETITPNKLRVVEAEVRRLAEATNLTPAQVQERLWKGFKLEQEGKGSDIYGPREILTRQTSRANRIGTGLKSLQGEYTGYTWNPDLSTYTGDDAIVSVASENVPLESVQGPGGVKLIENLAKKAKPLIAKYPELAKLGVFQLDGNTVSLDINLAVKDRAMAKRIATAFGQHSYWDPIVQEAVPTGLTGKQPNLSLGKAMRELRKILKQKQGELF